MSRGEIAKTERALRFLMDLYVILSIHVGAILLALLGNIHTYFQQRSASVPRARLYRYSRL